MWINSALSRHALLKIYVVTEYKIKLPSSQRLFHLGKFNQLYIFGNFTAATP